MKRYQLATLKATQMGLTKDFQTKWAVIDTQSEASGLVGEFDSAQEAVKELIRLNKENESE